MAAVRDGHVGRRGRREQAHDPGGEGGHRGRSYRLQGLQCLGKHQSQRHQREENGPGGRVRRSGCRERYNDQASYATDAKAVSTATRGKPEVWACAAVRVVGWATFLDDSSSTPPLKLTAID